MKTFTHESYKTPKSYESFQVSNIISKVLIKIQHSSQSRVVVRRGRPQKWDSGLAYDGMTNSGQQYLIIFLTN